MKKLIKILIILCCYLILDNFTNNDYVKSAEVSYEEIVHDLTWDDFNVSKEEYNYIVNGDLQTIDNRSKEIILKRYNYRKSLRYNDIIETINKINDEEAKLILLNPTSTIDVYHAKKESESKTIELYGSNLSDSNSDAFRHAYWNALMVKKITESPKGRGDISRGIYITKLFADAHEAGDNGQYQIAKEMDLHNNSIGRRISENSYNLNYNQFVSDLELSNLVKTAVDNGVMLRIVDYKLVPTIKPLNIWEKNTYGKWNHCDENGKIVKGWKKIIDGWYYFDDTGIMQEGWLYYNNKYYYLTPGNGGMKKGWQYINNNYYYFDDSGAMQTGWIHLDSKYYLNPGGQMQQYWKTINGNTYYFGEDGRMVTGYKYINNIQYYFNSLGILTKNPGSGYPHNPRKPVIMLNIKEKL